MIVTLPNFDPVFFSVGFISVRWYSLAYIAGIAATMMWLNKINKNEKIMNDKAYDNWLTWAVLSIIIGGRIGYTLFYNPGYFLNHPIEIIKVWHGGMSFHGGLMGAILGMWLFAKKYRINFIKLMDNISVIAPIGLFFGRIANFINMELYGRVTSGSFGIIFPNAGNLPRHPSQIYEAILEGLLLFLILFYLKKKTKIDQNLGSLSGVFLTGYGVARFVVEIFREPDYQLGNVFLNFTMGQMLSMPLIFFGLILILFKPKK